MAASSGRGPGATGLWLRWSWRDLRARWLQVVAIALIIALGTGSYAGLTSLTRWRRTSTDDAYHALQMYDLRVRLAAGAALAEGDLTRTVRGIASADAITAIEERLIEEIQVDASTDDAVILVPGLVYGVSLSDGGPRVNSLHSEWGRSLDESDAGEPVVLLERNFVKHYELPPEGKLAVSGGWTLRYVGHALAPEYFLVTTEQGGLRAEANFAAVFTSLETAQRIAGRAGQVNDLVLTLAPGADGEEIRRQIEAAFPPGGPVGATVMTRDEDPSFHLNDRDIEGDQQTYEVFALLIFGGAVGAAFNLSARVVDAQRREIGIAMVLRVPPARIALRPLLVGAQIALLGVILGVGVGILIGRSLVPLALELQPLPEWQTNFQIDLFSSVAIIGFFVPLLAVAWPVWRAVRVPPIETIRPAYRLMRGGGLAPLVRRIHLPGNTLNQAPLRNVVRAPRRSLRTGLGIVAALASFASFVGMIDSFLAATERGDREILSTAPDRVEVNLGGVFLEQSPEVQALLRPSLQRLNGPCCPP